MTRLHSRAAVVLSFAVNVVVTHAQPSESSKPPGASLSYVANDPLSARALRHRFSADQLAVMKMLNRADAARLPSLSLLIVPQSWPTKPLSYSPSPFQYDAYNDTAKPIVVDQAAQAFAAYEYGRLVRWEPVNSGRRSMQTPAGLFHLNWRSRGRHSTVDPSWFMPWYFNFHNTRGLSFHEYALPGRPASHACIRTLERDARWLYEWGETWTLDERGWHVLDPGTPVLILNCDDFDRPPPWRSSDWLAVGIQLPAEPNLVVRECGTS